MGGGRSAGRVRMEVDVDLSKAEAKLQKFGQSFGKSAGGVFVPTKVAADQAAAAVDKLAAAQKKLIDQHKALAAKKAAEIFTVPEKGAQEIAKLTAKLNQAERAFAGTGQQSQKLANYIEILRQKINAVRAAHGENLLPVSQIQAAAKEINALRARLAELERAFKGKLLPGSEEAKEINRVKDAIERLGGATDRNLNFIQRHAVAMNQLAFSAARAGSGFANFLPLIARTTTLLANMGPKVGGAGGGGLSGAFNALKGAAGGAASAIGSAGFAAIGAAAAVAALIVVVGFLTAKLGPLGSALTKAQNSIKLIFEGAGEDMLKFARTASTAFGITEQAALRFVGKTGQLFKSFGVGAEGAGQLSRSLLVAADVLRTTSTEFIGFEDALQAVFDTVAGNVEGLRRFDIFLSEIGLTQLALRDGFRVTTGTFDNFQRSLISQYATLKTARERFEQYVNTLDSTQRQAERTRAAFDDVKAAIGQGFAPILSVVSNILLGIVVIFKNAVNAISDFLERNDALVDGLKKIAAAAIAMFPGLNELGFVLRFLHDEGANAAESALDFDEALDELDKGLEEARDTFNKYKKTLTISELQQLRDAHLAVKEAVEDAARAEAEAIEDLRRTREDAISKSADALRDLAEAEEDADEAIFEARRKRHDVQIKNFRSIRDAEEKLSEAKRESAKRVEEAEKALDDAKLRRQDAILDAALSAEEAIARRDILAENRARLEETRAKRTESIEDARDRLEEAREESALKIARAKRDLEEERFDAIRRLQDATRELAQTIDQAAESLAEAQRQLHEAEIDINRSLFDAAKNLTDVRREGASAIADAKQNLEDLNFQLGTTDLKLADILDKLERMKNTLLSMPFPGGGGGDFGGHGASGGWARGGFMPKGGVGWIGEDGPELVVSPSNATVISNQQVLRVLRQLGSRGGATQNITVNEVANSPEATAFMVAAQVLSGVNN